MNHSLMYLTGLDAETLKEELLCFISEGEYSTDLDFVEQLVEFIEEDLSRAKE